MGKTVQTVKGSLAPELLGKTLTHEHLLWDQLCWWKGDPEELSKREFVHQKVCLENLGQIYYNAHQNLDNIQQYDLKLAIKEAAEYKMAGGSTIVEVSSNGLGRDPNALLAVSEMTGLNIVMGSGYYISNSHPAELKEKSAVEIACLIINEFENGVKDTGIKPGIIGEIGISDINNCEEIKVLTAAAMAQKETGAPLSIHPPIFETRGNDLLDVVEKAGGDLTRTVMCHCDCTLNEPDYHDSMARRGAFIEFDTFGCEFLALEGFFLPRDIDRIKAILMQLDKGNKEKLLLSHDIAFKTCLKSYGGWGYGHLLRDIVPFMKKAGMGKNELDAFFIDNPKRLLAY